MRSERLIAVFALALAISHAGYSEALDISALEGAEEVPAMETSDWDYPLPKELLINNEYIILANKTHLLEETDVPEDLVKLKCRKISSDPIQMREAAAEALSVMFDAAKQDGIVLYAHSGYRSYRTQKTMYYNRLKKNKGKDDGVVAYPGSSDHQTGLGIDVINKSGIGKRFTSAFAQTKEGKWIADHCWQYGFIIRYQKDKESLTEITYEPWHLRYVGVQVANYMNERNICLEEFTAEWQAAMTRYESADI